MCSRISPGVYCIRVVVVWCEVVVSSRYGAPTLRPRSRGDQGQCRVLAEIGVTNCLQCVSKYDTVRGARLLSTLLVLYNHIIIHAWRRLVECRYGVNVDCSREVMTCSRDDSV